MRYFIAFILLFCYSTFAHTQSDSRVFLAGTRISIQSPKDVLIPRHTSTLFIDSTIEFATLELPNIESAKEKLDEFFGPIEKSKIIEEFEITTNGIVKKCKLIQFSATSNLFQCYFGDSTYGILSQCIYKNTLPNFKERLTAIVASMNVDKDTVPNMSDYLSFTYSDKSIFKLVPANYVVEHSFTPNGERIDSMFTKTNIQTMQFPPAPQVKSSKDLMYASAMESLSVFTVKKSLFEGEYELNGEKAYKFAAICQRGKQTLEVCFIAIYNKKSSVFMSCQIIDDQYKTEAYDFLESVIMKKDGY